MEGALERLESRRLGRLGVWTAPQSIKDDPEPAGRFGTWRAPRSLKCPFSLEGASESGEWRVPQHGVRLEAWRSLGACRAPWSLESASWHTGRHRARKYIIA